MEDLKTTREMKQHHVILEELAHIEKNIERAYLALDELKGKESSKPCSIDTGDMPFLELVWGLPNILSSIAEQVEVIGNRITDIDRLPEHPKQA